jgi:signal transduction histidine kinase
MGQTRNYLQPIQNVIQETSLIEDRQTLLSVLLELTVLASELFKPDTSMLGFLERIAERLGCFAVLCIEVNLEDTIEVKLVESAGLSRLSRNTPIFYSKSTADTYDSGSDPPFRLKYRELDSEDLRCWSFPIPVLNNDAKPEVIYYLQLYFTTEHEPKKQYLALVTRLLGVLQSAMTHRRLYQNTLKALRIRDDFISIASHELRTPITSLRLQLQLIYSLLDKVSEAGMREDPALGKVSGILKMCEQQIRRLTHLIFGLLDVSKIQAGKLQLELTKVNLSELLSETMERLFDQMHRSGYEAKLMIEPNIIGIWDPFRLEQVFNNLIINAMKFGAGKPLEITLKRLSESTVQFSVKVQGIGIE